MVPVGEVPAVFLSFGQRGSNAGLGRKDFSFCQTVRVLNELGSSPLCLANRYERGFVHERTIRPVLAPCAA